MGVAVALIYVFQEKLVSGQRPEPLRWPARAAESSARCTRCAAHAALLLLNRPSPPAPSSTCRGCPASPTLTSAWCRSATASMQRCAAGRGGGAKGRRAAAAAAWEAARGIAIAPQAAALYQLWLAAPHNPGMSRHLRLGSNRMQLLPDTFARTCG